MADTYRNSRKEDTVVDKVAKQGAIHYQTVLLPGANSEKIMLKIAASRESHAPHEISKFKTLPQNIKLLKFLLDCFILIIWIINIIFMKYEII